MTSLQILQRLFCRSLETVGGSGLGGLLFNKTFVDGSAQVDATLEAISADNEVRLLARPTLTVTNNQEGQIQIGSDVPVEAGTVNWHRRFCHNQYSVPGNWYCLDVDSAD